MQVYFSLGRSSGAMPHVNNLQKAVNNGKSLKRTGNNNQDRADISPQGKIMNAIENLNKQKESIIQRKGELINKTIENGKDLKSIKEPLKMYEEQLENIDKQIEQITSDFAKSMLEEKENEKSGKSVKNESKEMNDTEKLTNLANAASSIKNAQTVSSVKNKTEGEVNVERAEIQIGELHVEYLESKGKGIAGAEVEKMVSNAKNALEVKDKKLDELMEVAEEILQREGEQTKEATKKLKGEEAVSTLESAAD